MCGGRWSAGFSPSGDSAPREAPLKERIAGIRTRENLAEKERHRFICLPLSGVIEGKVAHCSPGENKTRRTEAISDSRVTGMTLRCKHLLKRCIGSANSIMELRWRRVRCRT